MKQIKTNYILKYNDDEEWLISDIINLTIKVNGPNSYFIFKDEDGKDLAIVDEDVQYVKYELADDNTFIWVSPKKEFKEIKKSE